MNEDRAVLIGRVRKLLAMAEGNANEHEAAVAFDKAQRLMEQHGITGDEQQIIQAAALGVIEAAIDVESPLDWHILLAYTTAKYNFCATIPTAIDIRVVGLYEAVHLALRLYAYVESQVYDMPAPAITPDAVNSYRLGAVNRVRSRLTGMRGREVHNKQTALVTSHRPLIDEYIRRRFPQLAQPEVVEREMPALDWPSWQSGFDAGAYIKLEPHDDSWLGRSRETDRSSVGRDSSSS